MLPHGLETDEKAENSISASVHATRWLRLAEAAAARFVSVGTSFGITGEPGTRHAIVPPKFPPMDEFEWVVRASKAISERPMPFDGGTTEDMGSDVIAMPLGGSFVRPLSFIGVQLADSPSGLAALYDAKGSRGKRPTCVAVIGKRQPRLLPDELISLRRIGCRFVAQEWVFSSVAAHCPTSVDMFELRGEAAAVFEENANGSAKSSSPSITTAGSKRDRPSNES